MYKIKLFHKEKNGKLSSVSDGESLTSDASRELNYAHAKRQLDDNPEANVVQLVLGKYVVWEYQKDA
jgi:hypothetical protein